METVLLQSSYILFVLLFLSFGLLLYVVISFAKKRDEGKREISSNLGIKQNLELLYTELDEVMCSYIDKHHDISIDSKG